jgi:hypothetical protein
MFVVPPNLLTLVVHSWMTYNSLQAEHCADIAKAVHTNSQAGII